MRPLIGITTYATDASWGAWSLPAALIPLDYVDAVERAGGRAVLLPPSGVGVEETLEALDGIVFTGGADLDPALYGAEAHPETDLPDARRDVGELALLRAALERDLPTLAVCRGAQLLNVARGGDLVQHLPEHVGHDEHKETAGVFSTHPVEVAAGTRLADVVQSGARVASHHHQALGRLGNGLVETARAPDGTPEAVEDPEKRFVLGVQWHPEAGEDQGLFDALVEEARAHRAERERPIDVTPGRGSNVGDQTPTT